MYISLDWINDYVDLSDLDPKVIADRLTLATAEVEGVETVQRSVRGVLVGRVASAKKLTSGSDGKTLTLCEVDCGEQTYTTVCGAPNVRVGMMAPFAPAGVELSGGVKVAETEVHGRESQGMLCSAFELGMSRWHEGLLECPEEITPGTPLADFIPETDTLIEVDNKSLTHRPDLWGHYGFAREFAAVFRRPLKPLAKVDLSQYDKLPKYDLTIDDPEGCPCYACMEFDVKAAQPTPLVIQRRLHALGQRTYGLMIDLTNYCMLELGQPTHAFDARQLNAVRIAPMGSDDGTFTTLDGQERMMLPDDLLIWNEKEPVALAGVMGGLHSEVGDDTTRVLLESANFKSSRIRHTSVRLDLRTDAAQRFEKSQPPSNTVVAIARILQLILDSNAELNVTTRLTVAGHLKDAVRTIHLEPGHLNAMAGIELSNDEIKSILESLGFTCQFDRHDGLQVGVPPYRGEKDISIEPDIVEEVLRVYGYDNMDPRMPNFKQETLHVEPSIRLEHRARKLLAGSHRFHEVHNYGWIDDTWVERLHYDPGKSLTLRNPAAQPCSRLRKSLLPNLIPLVDKNRLHRDAFRLFELGHVYFPKKDSGDGELREELPRLAGVSFQQSPSPAPEEHFRSIKGAIEDLGQLFGGPVLTFTPSTKSVTTWQVADHWVEIRQNGKVVGALGVLDAKALAIVAPDGGQVVWFELELDKLQGEVYPTIQYEPTPRFPGSWQDYSLVWDVDRGYSELMQCMDAFSHPLMKKRDFLVVYKGKGLPPGKGSYSLRYWIGAEDHTLTSEEIDDFRNAMLAFLKKNDIPLR